MDDALTESNYEELVEAAAGKTKAEVQALLAKRSPVPDAPATITTIPMQPAIPPSAPHPRPLRRRRPGRSWYRSRRPATRCSSRRTTSSATSSSALGT